MITGASVAVLGFLLTWRVIPRLTDDRLCVAFALASYLLKIVLTLVLYHASFYHWPILTWYQGEPGFWVFGEDAVAHHFLGRHLFYSWTGVAPLPNIDIGNWSFVVYVGLVYLLLGVHPLNVAFLNAWYGTAIIAAGIVMMRRWGVSTSSMRLGVALLAFWPSLTFWSTQLMKDPLFLTLIMLGLCVLVVMTESRGRAGFSLLLLPAGLGALAFLLTLIRGYTGLVFGLTTMLTAGSLAPGAVRTRAWPFLLRLLLSVVMVGAGFAASKHVDLSRLVQHVPASGVSAAPTAPRPQEQPARVEERAPAPAPAPNVQAPSVQSPLVSPAINQAPIVLAKPSEPLSQPTPAAPSGGPSQHAAGAPPRRPKGSLHYRIEGMLANSVSTHALYAARHGFVSSGGYSLVDSEVSFDNPVMELVYLPRGLSLALLSPFPWQWFDTGGRTRVFRIGSMVEVGLIYLLLLAFLLRIREARKYVGIRTGIVLVFVALTAIPMSLTVANLGTLFRLRLQFLIPLLLLMCVVDVLGFYRRLLTRTS